MKKFNLYFNKLKIGELIFDGMKSNTKLVYDDNWSETKGSFSVLPTINKNDSIHTGEHVYNYFENLMPEESRREGLNVKESGLDELLKIHSSDSAGAIDIYSHDYNTNKINSNSFKKFTLKEISDKFKKDSRNFVKTLEKDIDHNFSIAGAQAKFTCRFKDGAIYFPDAGGATTHIIKPIPYHNLGISPRDKDITPFNEFISMSIAKKIWADTPKVNLIESDGINFYCVERYDRSVDGENIVKSHQFDFCQLIGKSSSEKYEEKNGPTLAEIRENIETYCSNPIKDSEKYYDWILFNMYISNIDCHSKNISLVVDDDGSVKLAPFYDLLTMKIYRMGEKFPYMINGKNKLSNINGHDLEFLSLSFGTDKKYMIERAIYLERKIIKASNDVSREISEMDVSLESKLKMFKMIDQINDSVAGFSKSLFIGQDCYAGRTVCRNCGKPLKSLRSKILGLGPECLKLI